MAVEQAFLFIADIGGYTRFMRLHRMSLAHSQDITARLLEALIDAAGPLELAEIEGDAAFLYVTQTGDESPSKAATVLALAMHRAFHDQRKSMAARNICPCDACRQAGELKVKFVAHAGEVATQTIKDRTKLAGVDVIAVHRMLKNTVPVPEYILMSEAVYEQCDPEIRERAVGIEQDLEGLGTQSLHFVDLDGIALEAPPAPEATLPGRLKETVGVVARGMPALLGLRRRRSSAETPT
ncbi:MAG: DUF2652 domain-containing protein [Actinomycetota bacterium]|nr:DUF2652 domain-containing protein [Actinomycetota bacterium]